MEVGTEKIKALEEKIGYFFRNETLLKQALTHSSFANEQKINRFLNYERIEFLGDAVLELVASQYLYENFPDMPEGQMTKQRAMLVCEPALACRAREIRLADSILLGRGEDRTGGRNRDSILADVLEAVIGAVYLDGGLEAAQKVIHTFVLSGQKDEQLFHDGKTKLQEYAQKEGLGNLQYILVAETGPEHEKKFYIELYLNDNKIGSGVGKNKKAAEQQAAYQALLELGKTEKEGQG